MKSRRDLATTTSRPIRNRVFRIRKKPADLQLMIARQSPIQTKSPATLAIAKSSRALVTTTSRPIRKHVRQIPLKPVVQKLMIAQK